MDIARIVRPSMSIGGLEFSDRALRYLLVGRSMRIARWAQLALPPNIIENGKVVDEGKLTQALRALAHQARLQKPPFYVIGVLPPPQLYSQMLAFPPLSHEELGEAVLWNAQMLLPFKPEEIYFDWEERTKREEESLQRATMPAPRKLAEGERAGRAVSELPASAAPKGVNPIALAPMPDTTVSEAVLLLLAERKVVDPYVRSLSQAGFLPLALESTARSMSRLVERIPKLGGKTSVVIRFLEEGMMLAIISDGLPHFDYWRGWDRDERETFGRATDTTAITGILRDELRRVVQFAKTKFASPLFSFLVVRAKESNLDRRIEGQAYALAKSEFPELEASKFSVAIPSSWLAVAGASLRGFTPRAKDQMVSLAPVGTEEAFEKARREDFFSLWAKMTSVVLAALFALAFGLNIFFAQVERGVSVPFAIERSTVQNEIRELRAQAQALKTETSLIEETLKARIALARLIESTTGASQGIQIQRLLVERGEKALRIEAVAPSAQEAIRFRDRLTATGLFSSVELPLSTLTTATPFPFRVVAMIK